MRMFWMGLLLAFGAICAAAQPPSYRYIRTGEPADVAATSRSGFALMGGGTDLDEAFQFLCERAGGGDFLVLRATGGAGSDHPVLPAFPEGRYLKFLLFDVG